uniref:BTB domain-containing protein n=1 Tax=Rhabditophanes sp. KR3021 TaxID=114890 RepID=A0AC35TNE3_9BILA
MAEVKVDDIETNHKVLVHEDLKDEPHPNYYAKGESFEAVSNEENASQLISFTRMFKIHKDDFKEITGFGELLSPSEPLLTYHNFIAAYWKLSLMYSKNDTYDFIVAYVGPTKSPKDFAKGALGPNAFHMQQAPPTIKGSVRFGSTVHGMFESLTDTDLAEMGTTVKVYVASGALKTHMLEKIFAKSECLYINVTLIVAKTYFNIDKFIGRAVGIDTGGNNEATLASVLRKEKHEKHDFVFTAGDSSKNDSVEFYVHRAILAKSSPTLASIFALKHSLMTDQLLVVSNENRIIFPFLTENDMKVILTFLYSGDVELPKFDSFAKVGRVLSLIVSKDNLLNIFKQWDQQMANFLLDLVRENKHEMLVLATIKALIAIYSAPYGALPLSKRIAVSILASKINEAECTGKELLVSDELKEITKKCSIDKQLASVMQFKYLYTGVKKEYI